MCSPAVAAVATSKLVIRRFPDWLIIICDESHQFPLLGLANRIRGGRRRRTLRPSLTTTIWTPSDNNPGPGHPPPTVLMNRVHVHFLRIHTGSQTPVKLHPNMEPSSGRRSSQNDWVPEWLLVPNQGPATRTSAASAHVQPQISHPREEVYRLSDVSHAASSNGSNTQRNEDAEAAAQIPPAEPEDKLIIDRNRDRAVKYVPKHKIYEILTGAQSSTRRNTHFRTLTSMIRTRQQEH